MIKITLVEKHIVKMSSEYFKIIDDYSFKVKNLYNYANFIIRQEFINNKRWIRYSELEKICKNSEPYKNLMAQTTQQTLKLLDKNWTSFFTSIKDWAKNKDKYPGKPSLPRYKPKSNGRYNIIFTNQNCKIKEGTSIFPKVMEGLSPLPFNESEKAPKTVSICSLNGFRLPFESIKLISSPESAIILSILASWLLAKS